MNKTKWFEKKFDFSFEDNIFPSIIERLEKTPLLLKNKVNEFPKEYLKLKKNNEWSIQENIGHLIDLELIWLGRLEDILNGKLELRIADLENKKTNLANHNEKDLDFLIEQFLKIRGITINKLLKLSEKEIYKSALHPRLKTPMRTMDLFLFVAEHDRHHLNTINELGNSYNT